MSELERVFLTSAFTVVGGVLVFVVGQIIIKFIIEPLHDQAKIIGDITSSLTLFANTGSSMIIKLYADNIVELEARGNEVNGTVVQLEIERYKNLILENWLKADSASELLRKQASDLLAKTHTVPFYQFLSLCRLIPEFDDVLKASKELVSFSNSIHIRDSDSDKAQRIAKLLKLQVLLKR